MTEIKEGMLVWRWYPTKGKQKLGLGWTGPHQVAERQGRQVVKLKGGNTEIIVHKDHVKPYFRRETFAESESEEEGKFPGDVASDKEEDSCHEDTFEEEKDEQDQAPVKTTKRGRTVCIPGRYLD